LKQLKEQSRVGFRKKSGERIHGNGEVVEAVLAEAGERLVSKYVLSAAGNYL